MKEHSLSYVQLLLRRVLYVFNRRPQNQPHWVLLMPFRIMSSHARDSPTICEHRAHGGTEDARKDAPPTISSSQGSNAHTYRFAPGGKVFELQT